MLKKENSAYGGELLKTREGRSKPRPLDTKNTMHLVLRSSRARGHWSFKRSRNQSKIFRILYRFAAKYGIKIIAIANVGNHLHLHLKLSNRYTYTPFIRAITSSIVIAITGNKRWWSKSEGASAQKYLKIGKTFWDYRPYTRVVIGFRAVLRLRDYIKINELEGFGYKKDQARFLIAWENIEFENSV